MRLMPLLLLALPLVASAAQPSSNRPPASTPQAPGYLSSFDGYRKFAEQPLQNWADANDLVRRIGGWRTYARESQEAAKNAESRERFGPGGGGRDVHQP